MKRTADLHIHTTFSDGCDTPEEVVALAIKKELSAIAITDHDMIEGIDPAVQAAEGIGLEVIAGVELSTNLGGADIHILGYCFDIRHPMMTECLQKFQDVRVRRVGQIAQKLTELGMEISAEEILGLAGSDAVGRPHVAQAMVNRGYVRTTHQAFDQYIAEGKSAYIPKFKQTPQDAIALIRQAGGVAVMAHPMETHRDELIPGLVEVGLQGLEVYYPNTPKKLIEFYERIADKHGLIKTGGSDTHGKFREYSPLGIARVDYAVVEALKAASTTTMTND